MWDGSKDKPKNIINLFLFLFIFLTHQHSQTQQLHHLDNFIFFSFSFIFLSHLCGVHYLDAPVWDDVPSTSSLIMILTLFLFLGVGRATTFRPVHSVSCSPSLLSICPISQTYLHNIFKSKKSMIFKGT